jgi:hypothetical protein
VTRRSTRSDAVSTIAAADRYCITFSDEFFFALEGHSLIANGHAWRVEVCGIHSAAAPAQHWLQLQLKGPVAQALTLRVARLEVGYVLQVVRDWLEGSLPAALEASVTGRAYLPAFTS